MNLQQLEYIVAVDTHRHFAKAAKSCHITQATLSMMVKKLEEELGVTLFDRSRQPVVTTEVGSRIIAQARRVLHESRRMLEIVQEEKGELQGELCLGIIPTLAPYLLPLFMREFLEKYPAVQLKISELTTEEIIRKLRSRELDAGLLAIPLNLPDLVEHSLFFEEFVVYVAADEPVMNNRYVLAQDIDVNRLWLLEEGHCLRAQAINLCALKEREKAAHQLDFATGSIEMLKKIVALNRGITILPALAIRDMDEDELANVRHFQQPAPVREIGLVTYHYLLKEKLVQAFEKEVSACIPEEMKVKAGKEVVEL